MAVDPKDRERFEYAKDLKDSGFVHRFIQDQGSHLLDSDSERAAFIKGRDGEQLDGDKKDE